jgi:hypothetical protein
MPVDSARENNGFVDPRSETVTVALTALPPYSVWLNTVRFPSALIA